MHMHTHIDKSYIQQPLGHGCKHRVEPRISLFSEARHLSVRPSWVTHRHGSA